MDFKKIERRFFTGRRVLVLRCIRTLPLSVNLLISYYYGSSYIIYPNCSKLLLFLNLQDLLYFTDKYLNVYDKMRSGEKDDQNSL